ncbi:MAG: BON domain-containing protein [Nitrosomonas sp.]|nr:BON domain-containing protein [Nitrosomonas sp.]
MYPLRKTKALCIAAVCAVAMTISGCGDSGSGNNTPMGGTGGGYFDDNSLSAAIRAKLAATPELATLGLTVRVENSEVFLSGTAKNQAQVDNAVMQAWLVEGVKKVENGIVLDGS